MEFAMSDNAPRIDRPTSDPVHPSLSAARVPGRRRAGFGEQLQGGQGADTPRRSRVPGLARLVSDAVEGAGPIGGLVTAGLDAVGGGGSNESKDSELERMHMMQRESQAFNLEYMALQEAAQAENRRFTALSNLMKARHDTAKAAISNIRV